MRKNLKFGILALTVVAAIFTGCSKDDTTAPSISLVGSDQTVVLPTTAGGNSAWSDPGATATDEEDGTITTKIVVSGASDVDLNRKGTYTVTYSVSDEAGNSASVVRTISVINESEAFAGVYNNVTDSSYTFQTLDTLTAVTVITSDSINNLVRIFNFGGFGNSVGLYANFSGVTPLSSISMPPGQALPSPASFTQAYTSDSWVIENSASDQSFRIAYQYNDGVQSDVFLDIFMR